jgi:hypothetical protein
MKTYLPYYFKKIGISLVIIAFILSIIASINSLGNGFADGWNDAKSEITVASDFKIISSETSKTLTWISLSFSFSGFLLYMFSKEKTEDEFIQTLRYMSLAKSLIVTWIVTSILLIINSGVRLEGFYILQFQLVVYVIIFNYYKKWKFI